MKYFIIAALALYCLDRYSLEDLTWYEILLPVIIYGIYWIFKTIKDFMAFVDRKKREKRQEELKEKWRKQNK